MRDPVHNEMKARVTRAFERRFGKSTMPLVVKAMSFDVWRVVDTETGTWAEYSIRGSRIRRLQEQDNA